MAEGVTQTLDRPKKRGAHPPPPPLIQGRLRWPPEGSLPVVDATHRLLREMGNGVVSSSNEVVSWDNEVVSWSNEVVVCECVCVRRSLNTVRRRSKGINFEGCEGRKDAEIVT